MLIIDPYLHQILHVAAIYHHDSKYSEVAIYEKSQEVWALQMINYGILWHLALKFDHRLSCLINIFDRSKKIKG